MSDDFADIIFNEFGESVPLTDDEQFIKDVTVSSEYLNSLSAEERTKVLVDVADRLTLYGITVGSAERGYGVLISHECYNVVMDGLEEGQEGLSKDIEMVSQGVATHLTYGHLPGLPFDPLIWNTIYRLTLGNLRQSGIFDK